MVVDVSKSNGCLRSSENGVFRARFVACGYSQVSGLNFHDSFAPVVSDMTF
jgi:hypothetical protein